MCTLIPGFASIAEFARKHKLPYMTVKNHFLRGWCAWPRHIIDGSSSNPAYKCWENMVARCNNPNATKYNNYGGRGITLHPSWISFRTFLADMGPRPSTKHSIDRINSNGNYEPSNCRWATYLQQVSTKRRNSPLARTITKHRRRYIFTYNNKTYSFPTEREAEDALLRLMSDSNHSHISSSANTLSSEQE